MHHYILTEVWAFYGNQKFKEALADFDKTNYIKPDKGAMYMAALSAMYLEKVKPQTEKKNYKSAKQYFNGLVSGKIQRTNDLHFFFLIFIKKKMILLKQLTPLILVKKNLPIQAVL